MAALASYLHTYIHYKICTNESFLNSLHLALLSAPMGKLCNYLTIICVFIYIIC